MPIQQFTKDSHTLALRPLLQNIEYRGAIAERFTDKSVNARDVTDKPVLGIL